MDSATGVSFALYVAANFGSQVLNVEALEAAVKVPVRDKWECTVLLQTLQLLF